MAFKNLTVDFRSLSKIPIRDRAELAKSPQASEIFGNMTPSQIAQLLPSYYRNLAQGVSYGSMGGALSSGGIGGGSVGGGSGGGRPSGGNQPSGTAAPVNRPPPRPGLIEDIMQRGGQGAVGSASRIGGNFSPRQRAVLDFISKREGAHDPNIIFGGERYKSRLGLDVKPLTERTISEVINDIMPKLRQLSKADGYGKTNDGRIVGTSAVGTGQMIEGTLKTNLAALGIPEKDWDKIKFDETLQARLTLANFQTSGIGDPNSPPSTWNLNRLGQQYESLNTSRGHPPMTREEMMAIENASSEISETIPGATPMDQQNPPGADNGQIMPLLQGPESATTATVAPAGEVAQRTMILSLGTNDWDNSASTYQNTLDAIKAAKEKGYQVVVIPPKDGDPKFQKVHDLVVKAATESGATIEQPQDYSGYGGYHPGNEEYKRIGQKYPGAVVVGDSIANGIGAHVTGGKVVAKDGLNSSVIRTNMLSDDVPKNETVQQPQVQNFNVEVFNNLDPRIKEWYDHATPEDRAKMEHAITRLGAEGVNKIASEHPAASATAVSEGMVLDSSGNFQQNVSIDEDVMYGRKPYITGHDFAVPIYTNGTDGKMFDEDLTGMTPQAVERLKAAAVAAKAAGLTKLVVAGGHDSSGHVSHMAGTEFDVKGYDADGKEWTVDQRAITALGAAEVGSDRFGFYPGGTLHFGKADEAQGGPGLSSAWGPGGATSGVSLSQFNPGLEAEIAASTDRFGSANLPKSEMLEAHKKRFAEAVRQKEIEATTAQVTPTPTGTQPVTPAAPTNDNTVMPLAQGTQTATPAPAASGPAPANIPAPETQPNMKLGGVANLVDEQMSVKGADGKGFNFNPNEEVNIKDGKATVKNEYQKKTEETKQKTDSGMPQKQNQGSMKSSSSHTTNDFLGQAKHMAVPQSPSAQRHFEASRFNDKHFRGNGARNMT